MRPLLTLPRLLTDQLGIGASLVCLVHCLALPFALTGAAAFSSAAHEGFHVAVALVTIPLAFAAAWPGYREHRDRRVPLLLGLGAALFVLSLALHDALSEGAVLGLAAVGSAVLASGHALNYRLRRRCTNHGLPHHAAHG